MKWFYASVVLLALVIGCTQEKESLTEESSSNIRLEAKLQAVLDTALVDGAILIYDAQKEEYFASNLQHIEEGTLPASTYKIPNSIIALETGVVESDSTLFEWDGEDRALDIWERDMVFRDAFRLSCVPCYQQIARAVGSERMNAYLRKLNYPGMQVDSTNIDLFWLQGASKISPLQQIDFLNRFYNQQLPIKESTYSLMRSIMVLEENENYSLSGKTGWAIREGNNIGWFVGFLEKQDEVYFIATRVRPGEAFNMDMFARIRQEVSMEAFRAMGIIE